MSYTGADLLKVLEDCFGKSSIILPLGRKRAIESSKKITGIAITGILKNKILGKLKSKGANCLIVIQALPLKYTIEKTGSMLEFLYKEMILLIQIQLDWFTNPKAITYIKSILQVEGFNHNYLLNNTNSVMFTSQSGAQSDILLKRVIRGMLSSSSLSNFNEEINHFYLSDGKNLQDILLNSTTKPKLIITLNWDWNLIEYCRSKKIILCLIQERVLFSEIAHEVYYEIYPLVEGKFDLVFNDYIKIFISE